MWLLWTQGHIYKSDSEMFVIFFHLLPDDMYLNLKAKMKLSDILFRDRILEIMKSPQSRSKRPSFALSTQSVPEGKLM